LAILSQNKAKLCKKLNITLVFEKNANFFAENCRKSQKILIITSTPGILHWSVVSKHFSQYRKQAGELLTNPNVFKHLKTVAWSLIGNKELIVLFERKQTAL
jgi:hypothetical protein